MVAAKDHRVPEGDEPPPFPDHRVHRRHQHAARMRRAFGNAERRTSCGATNFVVGSLATNPEASASSTTSSTRRRPPGDRHHIKLSTGVDAQPASSSCSPEHQVDDAVQADHRPRHPACAKTWARAGSPSSTSKRATGLFADPGLRRRSGANLRTHRRRPIAPPDTDPAAGPSPTMMAAPLGRSGRGPSKRRPVVKYVRRQPVSPWTAWPASACSTSPRNSEARHRSCATTPASTGQTIRIRSTSSCKYGTDAEARKAALVEELSAEGVFRWTRWPKSSAKTSTPDLMLPCRLRRRR